MINIMTTCIMCLSLQHLPKVWIPGVAAFEVKVREMEKESCARAPSTRNGFSLIYSSGTLGGTMKNILARRTSECLVTSVRAGDRSVSTLETNPSIFPDALKSRASGIYARNISSLDLHRRI